MTDYKFPGADEAPSISELPDPFIKPDGTRVSTAEEWTEQREYLKEMLAHYMYGHMPEGPFDVKSEVTYSRPVYHGQALAENVRITVGELSFEAELIRPVTGGKVPVFTWNQFTGRHGCPIEEEVVLKHGYAIVEFDKEQLAPDNGSARDCALARMYPECDWGAIAMWAWGHSRIVDYLLTTDWADPEKIIATGHSRGGKVAMCAAIYDERIALCAASGSGCGGAGCFRFLGGRLGEGIGLCETAGTINDMLGYWWTDEFAAFGARQKSYSRSTFPLVDDMREMLSTLDLSKCGVTYNEDRLPFDLHFAKALIAPRALITTDGLGDTWANPFGTQVTWRAAQEVFDFLGVPANNAFHFREGPHEFQKLDWKAIVGYCDEIFFGIKSKNNVVCFREEEQNGPMAAVNKFMDFRNTRLHYSWRAPVNKR